MAFILQTNDFDEIIQFSKLQFTSSSSSLSTCIVQFGAGKFIIWSNAEFHFNQQNEEKASEFFEMLSCLWESERGVFG